MANISVTYTFTNGTTADATEVNTNFTDIINGTSDGTKDISVSAITAAGTATFNGAVNLGNATTDDITITGRFASDLDPKTAATYTLGDATQTWQALYLDNSATDGGAVYFNAGTTAFLKANAAGTNLATGGFTSILIPDGSAAAPSLYSSTGTSDTGIFMAVADQVGIATAGVERVEWGTSEVVFNDSGASYDFRVEGDTDASLLVVDASSDRVGIGQTTPSSKLDIGGTNSEIQLNLGSAGAFGGIRGTRLTVGDGFFLSAGGGADSFACVNGGNFGVATSAPAELFEAEGVGTTSKRIVINSTSTLSNGVAFSLAAREAGADLSSIGGYNHAGITNATGFLSLQSQDGAVNYIWTDDSDILRISTTVTHIGTTSGTVVGTQTSDERLKSNIQPLEYGLDEVLLLEPLRYKMFGENNIGFSAQRTENVIPEACHNTNDYLDSKKQKKKDTDPDPDDPKDKRVMTYSTLIPVLVNAIKELAAKNVELEARVAALESV